MNSFLFPADGRWHVVSRCDVRARALADRHYSRQSVGARDFMASGRTLVMLTDDERAVWGVIENLDPAGRTQWRCSIFRNEGAGVSSTLIREATARTFTYWRSHYGRVPGRLTTEIDTEKVRRKRDPGRCFLRAGWERVGLGRGHRAVPLVVLAASLGADDGGEP